MGKKAKAGHKKKEKKRKRRSTATTVVLLLLCAVGAGIMLYPTVSDLWNSYHQSQAIAGYDEAVQQMTPEEIEAIFEKAETYNKHLAALSAPFFQYSQLEDEYYGTLDITGTGIMGYISIPVIDVELPIYHGTDEAVLNIAAGHLEGSTLPIGGEGRHSVISAHRGLPRAMLFTDLDELEEGDIFKITILDRLFTYKIDQILIVEPDQLEALNIEDGEDYITLMTCTPYGINSHRMLVRGHRIENGAEGTVLHADATKIPLYIAIPAVAIPALFALLLVLLISYRKRPKTPDLKHIKHLYGGTNEKTEKKEKTEQKQEEKEEQP